MEFFAPWDLKLEKFGKPTWLIKLTFRKRNRSEVKSARWHPVSSQPLFIHKNNDFTTTTDENRSRRALECSQEAAVPQGSK